MVCCASCVHGAAYVRPSFLWCSLGFPLVLSWFCLVLHFAAKPETPKTEKPRSGSGHALGLSLPARDAAQHVAAEGLPGREKPPTTEPIWEAHFLSGFAKKKESLFKPG